MSHFNIRTLEYLNAISRYGSLRKAAARLHVDPSAISRMISQLEEDIGMLVWQRNSTKRSLTPAGQELLKFFRTLIANESATHSRLQNLKNLRFGKVCIVVGEGFINDFISQPLQSFLSRYPGIQLKIETAGALDAIKLLEDEQIDFAVTYGSMPHPRLYSHLSKHHPLDIIAPTSHLLTKLNRPITMQEVSQYPLALIDVSTGMGRLVHLAEQLSNLVLEPRLRTNSVSVLKNYVASGLGISFMPRLTVIDEVNAGNIKILTPDLTIFSNASAHVLSLPDRKLTLPAQALLDHLIATTQFLHSDAPAICCSIVNK
ncbi:MAG: LysR family transcriptional regulator [Ostreibacterium sp.]